MGDLPAMTRRSRAGLAQGSAPAFPSTPPLSSEGVAASGAGRSSKESTSLRFIPKVDTAPGDSASAHSIVAFLLSLSKVKGTPGPAPAADVASNGPLHLPWTEVCLVHGADFPVEELEREGESELEPDPSRVLPDQPWSPWPPALSDVISDSTNQCLGG